MKSLAALIADHEEWLMGRVLAYARRTNYVKYTSTLEEAWRISIHGLSESMLAALASGQEMELDPDEDYSQDPLATFGILEAKRHRARGITLSMFLGLMKYYKQAYRDLVKSAGFAQAQEDEYLNFVERYFDRLELGFCSEWLATPQSKMLEELQQINRLMTNEKNKFLTIFESMANPVVLLNAENKIDYVNYAAAELIHGPGSPGASYYREKKSEEMLPWLATELHDFLAGEQEAALFERELETRQGKSDFQIKLRKMLDVSLKFQGVIVFLDDVSALKQAQREVEREAQIRGALNELSTLLISCRTLDEITGHVLDYAKKLTDSPFGFVGYIDSATGYLISQTLTRDIWQTCQVAEKTILFKEFRGLWGWVLNNKKPLLTNESYKDPRASGVPAGHIPINRFVSVPALDGDRLVGQIAMANAEREYVQKDVALLARLAALYTIALQRQRVENEQEKLIVDLRQALAEVKQLSGLLPICASCKKIRDDQGYWNQIEDYIHQHSEAQFSHSVCPECSRRLYPELTKKRKKDSKAK